MATELTAPPASAPATKPDDSLGLDRAFLFSMARIPLIAVGWVVLAMVAHLIWAACAPGTTNFGPMIVLAGGMILAAVIDGWAFKVPNWVTLSLVMSGWYIGLMHTFGWNTLVPGFTVEHGLNADGVNTATVYGGGILESLLGTFVGFALLFPILFIQGMGQGDVKMQMGFGSWCGALFGGWVGVTVLVWAFVVGVIVGGVFGVVMMLIRGQFGQNKENFRAIFGDLQTLFTKGAKQASDRANARRPNWVRLPYGVPLCVGFLGYLAYRFVFVAG